MPDFCRSKKALQNAVLDMRLEVTGIAFATCNGSLLPHRWPCGFTGLTYEMNTW